MRRPRPHITSARRGLTLLELMLALTITALVGLGVCSMLAMVSRGAGDDKDRRSTLLRAHAAQVRLRAYVAPALCVLQHDPTRGLALWLQDERPMNNVHLSELRIVWWDATLRTITVERAQFPEEWPQLLKDQSDTVIADGANYFDVMVDLRRQGFTATETLMDGVVSFTAGFNQKQVLDSDRMTIALSLEAQEGGQRDVLLAFGLPGHRKPG